MPFTGSATVKSKGKYKARITGLSLAVGAVGTIGLPGDAGADVQLPAGFPTEVDAHATEDALTMSDVVRANAVAAAANANGLKIRITKGGTPFRISIQNDDATNATPALEILADYDHSYTR